MQIPWCANDAISSTNESSDGSIGGIATLISTIALNISVYVAVKAAVRGLVGPLAMELVPRGIRVNCLGLGYMMTDMVPRLQEKQPMFVKQFEKETLFGSIGFPEELKGGVYFLVQSGFRVI